MTRFRIGGPIAALTLALPAAVSAAPTPAVPLIGANYSHWRNRDCSLSGTGIVATYDHPAVRARVRAQLAEMHAAGIQTLRLIVWHMHDPTGRAWGVIPSAGGSVPEPYRTNLIDYVSDVRDAGFLELTVAMGPESTNSPGARAWDPALEEENWTFLEDVRALVVENGPPVTHFDIDNEASPSDAGASTARRHLTTYLADLYGRYVQAFGADDVTISSITNYPSDGSRLRNLIAILRSTGEPLPRWFEVHLAYDGARALAGLRRSDATLQAAGLDQPLVIGEAAYDSTRLAAAIASFVHGSSRPVAEVIEWPLTIDRPCPAISVSAPYRADAYQHALSGPQALSVTVTPGGAASVRTGWDVAAAHLTPGHYLVTIHDDSATHGFELTGPGVARRTGTGFTGTTRWPLSLRPGATYRYRLTPDRTGASRLITIGAAVARIDQVAVNPRPSRMRRTSQR